MKESGFARPGAIPGCTVRGRVVLPEGDGPFPVVLCSHGYTISCQWGFWPELARRLAALGVASVRYNASGDGFGADLTKVEHLGAVSRNTYSAELADLATVRTFVGMHPELDAVRTVTVGHSRGGVISLLHASGHGGYLGVVTWAAADSVLRFSKERIARWRETGTIDVMHYGLGRRVTLQRDLLDDVDRHPARFDVCAAIRRLGCPALIVHGARDQAVPVACAHVLARAAGEQAVVIDDAGHSFGARDPLVELPPRLERLFEVTLSFVTSVI